MDDVSNKCFLTFKQKRPKVCKERCYKYPFTEAQSKDCYEKCIKIHKNDYIFPEKELVK
jgi:hypothetical protein